VETQDIVLVLVVVTALAFDFTNGFHDTANAMATSIATKALKPKVAVALAALLNFVGAFISLKVAAAIAEDIVDAEAITTTIILAGLLGGIFWNRPHVAAEHALLVIARPHRWRGRRGDRGRGIRRRDRRRPRR
jgi:phosphate/sulfate permease